MPRDLVSTIKALRKDSSPSVYELEEAVVELAHRIQRLQQEVDELKDALKSRRR